MKRNKDYLLGTSNQELQRLGYQHQVWQDVTETLWRNARFGFGQSILDLGCGPGFASIELARLVGPDGRIEAIDAAETFLTPLQKSLDAAGLDQVRVQQGNAQEIPLPDCSVDRVWVRWLMCFVADPSRVCEEISRVLRPGGKVVIWDYYNYLSVNVFPEQAAIHRIFQAYYQSALKSGGSFDIAQYLPGMLLNCGLEVEQLLPINRAARPGSVTWQWVSLFHDSYLPKLVEQGLMGETEAVEFRAAWQDASNNPAAFFFTPPMLGIIASKPLGQSGTS
ncbi:MAG TPA: methyltransferase domain-containing protein [Xanthomonadales bacterium]|nr:methyltransferase domain-containing protein [Xanthomonadales bacterium]